MVFPQEYSFFFAGNIKFSFHSTLPSARLVYRLPCYKKLSIFNWVTNLIDLIFYVFCLSFMYTLVYSCCAFRNFLPLILVGFLLCIEKRFYVSMFFLTTSVSHGTLGLVICFIGIHSVAASKWALTKFSLKSFTVGVSQISLSESNVFFSINVYLSPMSLRLSRIVIVHCCCSGDISS